jgi:hypothetical protein
LKVNAYEQRHLLHRLLKKGHLAVLQVTQECNMASEYFRVHFRVRISERSEIVARIAPRAEFVTRLPDVCVRHAGQPILLLTLNLIAAVNDAKTTGNDVNVEFDIQRDR